MGAARDKMVLSGNIRLSEIGRKRTGGGFNVLIEDNRNIFRKYFGVDLFAGSLNIDVPHPQTLQRDLDQCKYKPAFEIPKGELVGMPHYIGDGQAWRASLKTQKAAQPISCQVFRRIRSQVPKGVIEVLAKDKLTAKYGFVHGDAVELVLLEA